MDVKFDEVQNYILPRLVYKDNAGGMSYSKPFLGDISIVFRILVEESEDETKSIIVTPKMVKDWHITHGLLFEQAKRNWFEQNTLCSFTLGGGLGAISVEGLKFGATCLLDPYIFKNFVERSYGYDGDFCIIPSAIHEVIVFDTDSLDVKVAKEMLTAVNADRRCMPERDILSYNILKYNSETKQIEIA